MLHGELCDAPSSFCEDAWRFELDVSASTDGEQHNREKGFEVKQSRHSGLSRQSAICCRC